MRVSERFSLGRTQSELDFVDVDDVSDIPVFLDPRALRLLETDWAAECVHLVQHFFRTVLEAIEAERHVDARNLLQTLREPNETHLGFSEGRARGRALGPESAHSIWSALAESQAAKTGLLEDLEDAILLVEGIGPDIVSDITTNVIREPLIRYTQTSSEAYGVPLKANVDSGPLWNSSTSGWEKRFERLPMGPNGKLLLVPKVIVSRKMDYDTGEYYRHYLLEEMKQAELSANTELVHLLKNGTPRVTKEALIEKYGEGKRVAAKLTQKHPEALNHYRATKRNSTTPPLDHTAISEVSGAKEPHWDELLSVITNTPSGASAADAYHKAVEKLLSALFYPSLSMARMKFPIHNGRKRIDLTYTNSAAEGFFHWLSRHYPAPYLYIKCKNYSSDPANPELDQLGGRFSPS